MYVPSARGTAGSFRALPLLSHSRSWSRQTSLAVVARAVGVRREQLGGLQRQRSVAADLVAHERALAMGDAGAEA